MSSLSPKDRASLCRFTFSDGRLCRSPRSGSRSLLCPFHTRKVARSKAADKLSRHISYFLSGDYLSACDLGTALGRLIPAVIRGDVKPKTARTVAYLAQTLAQTIPLAQHEYINAFSTDGWRRAVRDSVGQNAEYRHPSQSGEPQEPPSQPQPPQPLSGHSQAGAGSPPRSPAPPPAPSPTAPASPQPGAHGLRSETSFPASASPCASAAPESSASFPASARPFPPQSPGSSNLAPSGVHLT